MKNSFATMRAFTRQSREEAATGFVVFWRRRVEPIQWERAKFGRLTPMNE
jgi:hypothetical protein